MPSSGWQVSLSAQIQHYASVVTDWAQTVPGWITGEHPRLAVRVTAHAQAAALCKTVGMAIVSTSANRSGGEPTRSFRDTVRRFRGEVDYVLPGRVGDATAPTPIRDAVTGELIRAG